jgi:nucleoside-diphosphate-sugar epimerase
MNALVTGATGFIGSHLVKELVREKHSVRALVLPGEDVSALETQGMTVWRGDLSKRESLRGICDGTDVVFHLAARVTDWGTKKQIYDAIYTATKNLIEEASGNAARFVYISSIAALGCNRHLKGVKETDQPQKSGIPYNDAKLDTERLVKSCHDSGRIACTIVRPANVTGPGSVWVRDVLDKMKGFLPIVGGGANSSSFVYIDNLVDGIILAGTKDIAKGNIYHFRDDWNVSWKQYLNDLGSLIGKKPAGSIPFPMVLAIAWVCDIVCTPLRLRPPLSRFGVYIMGRDYDVDTALTQKQLGWKTKVPYEEAIQRIGVWVKEVYSKQ